MENNFSQKLLKEEVKYQGKTLLYKNKYYLINKNGKESKVTWETIENSPLNDKLNLLISVIPLIKKENKIVLVENFEYATERICLQFPSDFIVKKDWNDTLKTNDRTQIELLSQKTASNILKILTGYEGTFKKFICLPKSNPIKILTNAYAAPWDSSDNGLLLLYEINEQKKQNNKLKTYEIKLEELLDFISNKISKENYGCSYELYSFALGMNFKSLINRYPIFNQK